MRRLFTHLGNIGLGCGLAFGVEILLFVAWVACLTSFGFLMPVVCAAARVYFFPAEPFGRSFDGQFGIHWLLLPVFWGLLAYAIRVFITRLRSNAA